MKPSPTNDETSGGRASTATRDLSGVFTRRRVLMARVGGAATLAMPTESGPPPTTVRSSRMLFDHLRALGQSTGPDALIPPLVTQLRALRRLAADGPPAGHDAALVLAARFAEYIGWLAQESGDDVCAARWTDHAVRLADAGQDADMGAHALVRHGLIALYLRDDASTVELARAAAVVTRNARISGLAAQREAQGHALAGDYGACMRAIDRAAQLGAAHRSAGDIAGGGPPTLGPTQVADPVAMVTGWCLVELGRPARAVDVLTREIARISPHALRARARYGARLALAHAMSGEPESACATLASALDTSVAIDSATIRAQLRDVSWALRRWHTHPVVRATRTRLAAASRTSRS